MEKGEKRICAQIDQNMLMQFLSYWCIAGKPCDLLIKPSTKSSNLVGVVFNVKPYDRAVMDFMERAKAATGAKIWELTKQ